MWRRGDVLNIRYSITSRSENFSLVIELDYFRVQARGPGLKLSGTVLV